MRNSLLQSDLDARHEVLDVSRSFIVQAPAGSGKTELLIQRYLCLLATVNDPEEIIAITFTRKAAQEMQNRVTAALLEARDGIGASEEHKKITLDAALNVLKRDSDRQWQLVDNPRRMRIQTLDSFNSGIARSLPVSSGLGGIGRVRADAEMGMMLREAAIATLDWLTEDGPIASSVREILTHLDNNVSVYVSYLSHMLQKRDQWLSLIGTGLGEERDFDQARVRLEMAICEVIENQLAKLIRKLPDEIEDDAVRSLRYASANLNAAGIDDPTWSGFGDVDAFPGASVQDRDGWQRIAGAMLTLGGTLRKSLNKNNGFPAGDDGQKKRFLDVLDQLRSQEGVEYELDRVRALPDPCYSDEQWQVLLALFRLLPTAVAELRRLFAERSVCDHTEVAIAATAALGTGSMPGDAAMMLDYRIRHVLVDEMQDTSLGQYHLLEKLTEGWTPGDGRTLFCVGDPMQSIYRFRDAEVGQFVLARDNGVGQVRPEFRLLRQNFRSGENIVHWFNTIFGQIMPVENDVSAGAIAFSESIAVASQADAGMVQLHPLIDQGTPGEAAYCAALLEKMLAEFPGETVTLLVRSRTQLTELLADLRSRGIRYEAVDIDRLTDLPEVIDLLALTRAFCHEADRIAWLGLLHGPLVGMTWHDIHALVAGDSRMSIAELFVDRDRMASLSADGQNRLSSFLEAIREFQSDASVAGLRSRVEPCWFALGGPAVLGTAGEIENAYQYLNVLEGLERAGTLPDSRELESLLDSEHISRLAGADCKLQIMTMHKAKGLQFDHVVLYGLGRRTRGSQKSVLSWLTLPEGSESDMIISPVGARADLENDSLHQFIEKAEADKQRHELDRLLYVACTRPRKSLNLIGNVQLTTKGELRDPPAGSLLHRLWPAVAGAYARAFDGLEQPEQEADVVIDQNLQQPISRRFVGNWSRPGIDAIPLPRITDPDNNSGDNEVEYYWVGSVARHAGTIVHRWLQRISESSAPIRSMDDFDHWPTSRIWARQIGVPDSDLEGVCKRVDAALHGILKDEKGRWLLEGQGHCELPLTGVWKDSVYSIVIDRIRIDDDDVHWIVDYKTGTHEGGDIEQFLKHEEERHHDQIEKYAAIYGALKDVRIRRALYFPLLQEFREL